MGEGMWGRGCGGGDVGEGVDRQTGGGGTGRVMEEGKEGGANGRRDEG